MADLPQNLLHITVADLAQLLIAYGSDYSCTESNLLYYRPSGGTWKQVQHLRIALTSNAYGLSLTLVNGKEIQFFASPVTTPTIAISPTHPLLKSAPPLPPYFYRTNDTFISSRTATLTIPQSLRFIQELTSSYQIPEVALADWNIPLTLTLWHVWPTPEEPYSARLAVEYTSAYGVASCAFQIDTKQPLADIKTHTLLQQNVLLGVLLSKLPLQLQPYSSPLKTSCPQPWALVHLAINPPHITLTQLQDLPRMSPSLAAYQRLASPSSFLLANPTLTPPAFLGQPISPQLLNSLPLIHLNRLFEHTSSDICATLVEQQLSKLHDFQNQIAYQHLAC